MIRKGLHTQQSKLAAVPEAGPTSLAVMLERNTKLAPVPNTKIHICSDARGCDGKTFGGRSSSLAGSGSQDSDSADRERVVLLPGGSRVFPPFPKKVKRVAQ